MSRAQWIIPTALLGLALLTAGCSGESDAAARTAERTAVSVAPENVAVAQLQELAAGPALSGSLVPERQAALRAEVGGMVVEVRAEPGQRVATGQVLVRLDNAAQADAAQSARSAVRTAREALTVAQRNAERSERLAQAGALADRDLELARWNAMSAEATLADAEARLTLAERLLQKTTIRAPFAGIVSEREVRTGDVVQLGAELATVVDLRSLRLEANVPVSALGAMKVGTTVDFSVAGYDRESFQGKVWLINPVVDPATGQVRVIADIPNLGERLVAGLFAEGRVATERRSALAVPLAAVDLRGPTPLVRRLRLGLVELVAVELGIQDEARELVEIKSGLTPGDTVLAGGATGIAAGTPVVIKKE